jgi:DNA-directed RNA polymerase specialized sigma24 family protein
MRSVARSVGTSTPQVIEDSCAFAWAAFLERQPDRDRNWRGWLFRTAQRQAWKLEQSIREVDAFEPTAMEEGDDVFVSPVDEIELRNDVNDALSVIGSLPLRLQRIALLRALGFSHEEIGGLTGDSKARVHALVVQANRRIAEQLVARSRSGEAWSSRAERLWQLEHSPPEWLLGRIGRPVLVRDRSPSPSVRRLVWRRAAIALDDLRRIAGAARFDEVMERPPREPELRRLHVVAKRAVAAYEFERNCWHRER